MRKPLVVISALLLCRLVFGLTPVWAQASVTVEGLMPKAAFLKIDGQRKMLRIGQSFNGVKLLATGATTATLELNGQRLEVGLSRHVATTYERPEIQSVIIPRDDRMQYITSAEINGRQIQVLVDTGASSIAMSETQANALGIDHYNGTPIRTLTASGEASARLVTLSSVTVGGIRVENVQTAVVEGDFPHMVLLGMSFLQHVKMQDENGVLTISQAQ